METFKGDTPPEWPGDAKTIGRRLDEPLMMREEQFERLYAEHAPSLLAFLVYRTGDRVLSETSWPTPSSGCSRPGGV